MKRTLLRRIIGVSSISLISLMAVNAYAAGYKLEFQSASVLGDAGDAAVVEDASTNWYNSAGLPYVPRQVALSLIDVYAPTTFSGTVFAPSLLGSFSGNGSASSHPNNVLPALHVAYPINCKWALGLTVAPAWGFSENYGNGSVLRYDLVYVNTTSMDIAPSVAYKLNDQWSFGIGPDAHYFLVDSKQLARLTTTLNGQSRYRTSDWGWGGHAGVLFRINDNTRIGLNYRSKMVMELNNGFSDLSFPAAFTLATGIPSVRSNSFKLRVVLPPTTTLSFYHDMTPCWALMGSIAYDQWSVLRNYYAQNYQSVPSIANPTGVLPAVYVQQDMSNTFDLGFGTHYKLNPSWMLRGSVKYEPTPTQNRFRDVNFPDGSKLGFQIGARYTICKGIALDMLYGHVFVNTAHIGLTQPVTAVTVNGHNRTSVDLFGAQLVWNV